MANNFFSTSKAIAVRGKVELGSRYALQVDDIITASTSKVEVKLSEGRNFAGAMSNLCTVGFTEEDFKALKSLCDAALSAYEDIKLG